MGSGAGTGCAVGWCSPVAGPVGGVVMAGVLAHHLQAVEGSREQECLTSQHGERLLFFPRLGESIGVRCAGQTPLPVLPRRRPGSGGSLPG